MHAQHGSDVGIIENYTALAEGDPVTITPGNLQFSENLLSMGYTASVVQNGVYISSIGATITYGPHYAKTSIVWTELDDGLKITALSGSATDMRAPSGSYVAKVSVYIWLKDYPGGGTQGFHQDFTYQQ